MVGHEVTDRRVFVGMQPHPVVHTPGRFFGVSCRLILEHEMLEASHNQCSRAHTTASAYSSISWHTSIYYMGKHAAGIMFCGKRYTYSINVSIGNLLDFCLTTGTQRMGGSFYRFRFCALCPYHVPERLEIQFCSIHCRFLAEKFVASRY
jgi:hypothetical protein